MPTLSIIAGVVIVAIVVLGGIWLLSKKHGAGMTEITKDGVRELRPGAVAMEHIESRDVKVKTGAGEAKMTHLKTRDIDVDTGRGT